MPKFNCPNNPKMNSQPTMKNIAGANKYARSIFVTQDSRTATRKITGTTAINSMCNHQNLVGAMGLGYFSKV
jgi:hypothetical protein